MQKNNPLAESLRLLKKDRRFAPLIKRHGPPDLKRGNDIFAALLRSIIYQQLSGKAAGAIHKRFLALFPRKKPTPPLVLEKSTKTLRMCGLSMQKVTYVRDLAKKFANKSIDHTKFPRMQSGKITEHLLQVKGIGEWTTHMLLIFTLNRPDILPTGDLGIRKGFQILYRLSALPDKREMEELARPWRSSATAASWYLWRVADEAKG